MKKYFKVTFEYAEGIYCTNLAHAETAEDVEREYSKYPWQSVKEAQPWDVEEAKMKGMPIIEVEAATAEDPEAVTLAPAEDAQVWDENGETVTPDTDTDTEEEEEENTVEKIKVVYEKKEGRTYTETWRSENPEEVYERLSHSLIAKKLNNCGWIRSIKRVPLYNGFDRITVTHDNGGRDVYTVASH